MTIDLMCREIRGQHAKRTVERYFNSIKQHGYRESIKECYKNPSIERLSIEQQYKEHFLLYPNARDYTIISATNYGFSVGFIADHEDGSFLFVLSPYFVGYIDLSKVGY